MKTIRMSTRGRVTIPKETRQRLGFTPRSRVEISGSRGVVRVRLAGNPKKPA